MKIYNPMTSYPNQITTAIHKKKEGNFLMVNIKEIRCAASELSPAALKLYLYFVENQDGFLFHLSPKDFTSAYNVSESTYRRAKAELIEKGYAIQEGNELHFYANKDDVPLSDEEYKKKINAIGKTLIKEGIPSEELKDLVKPAKNLEGKSNTEKIQIYKEVLKELQAKAEEYFSNNSLI